MDKVKRVLALVTVGVIAICIILTLVFAIIYMNTNKEFFKNAWMASAFCMFLLPIFLWVMFWIYRLLKGRGVNEEPAQAEQVAAETVVVEAVQTEDEPEPTKQTEQPTQAEQEVPEIVEEEPAVTEETPIQLYEPALDVVCEELPQEDTEQCDVPFKLNYWNVLRYYWGSTAVGDNAPRNYWRYGKARL